LVQRRKKRESRILCFHIQNRQKERKGREAVPLSRKKKKKKKSSRTSIKSANYSSSVPYKKKKEKKGGGGRLSPCEIRKGRKGKERGKKRPPYSKPRYNHSIEDALYQRREREKKKKKRFNSKNTRKKRKKGGGLLFRKFSLSFPTTSGGEEKGGKEKKGSKLDEQHAISTGKKRGKLPSLLASPFLSHYSQLTPSKVYEKKKKRKGKRERCCLGGEGKNGWVFFGASFSLHFYCFSR